MPKKSKENTEKPTIVHKPRLLTIGWILVSIGVIVELYATLANNPAIAANFADDVMRPTIGNQATISIEAFVFNIEDQLNRIEFSFVKPNLGTLTANSKNALVTSEIREDKFVLENIPPLPNLPPLAGEGVWNVIKTASADTVMAETVYRPDRERDYAIVYLVKMNMGHLSISAVAGSREPGGYQHAGTGKIPADARQGDELVAAFNGGFQQKDGHYGMIVGNTTYLPLQNNLATLVIYKNDRPKIIDYTGQPLGNDVAAIRQNGPMLLQDSIDVSSSSAWTMQTWGLTTTNSMYTWRSALGVTKNGNLIYVAGPSLVPETLAAALKAAGAVNGMQLDINPVWVRFVLYDALGNGRYTYHALTDAMQNGGYSYLYGYQKDFFYLTEK